MSAALEEYHRTQEGVVKRRSSGLSLFRRHRILMFGAVPVVAIILAVATLQVFHGTQADRSVMYDYYEPSTSRDRDVTRSSPANRYAEENRSTDSRLNSSGLIGRLEKDGQAQGNALIHDQVQASQTTLSNQEFKRQKAEREKVLGVTIPSGPTLSTFLIR